MASQQESSANGSPDDGTQSQWGRVLICGGTDWPKLGRKERGGANKEETENPHPDLLEPHILRSLSNVKIASIHTSCCSCYCIALDIYGAAWMFGRNSTSALGSPKADAIWESSPKRLKASDLGAPPGTRFVHAASGRTHSLLVDSNGEVWTSGGNNLGQCGHQPCAEIPNFKMIEPIIYNGTKQKIVKAGAGVTFSIILTEAGKVFSFGSGQCGQLGNGRTGEHITTGNKTAFDIESDPIPVKGFDDRQIADISCGPQHAVALDVTGMVYVWGYNGYCRLGLGNQVDALIPKAVPQFSGPNIVSMGQFIAAGPSSTAVVDKQGMYYIAGKWKNSGEGSSGSPNSTFRFIQEIMGCKIQYASAGGVTHWALAPDEDGTVMTIAWGQNAANGELGLGPDEPKSATKPTRHQPLIGIDVFAVAAAQNSTLFLAKPNVKFSDLPRYPLEVEAPEFCIKCGKDNGDDDAPLECDKCDHPYHLGCLDPPLEAVPDGEWFCPKCSTEAETWSRSDADKSGQKKGAPKDEDGEEDDAVGAGTKRKASSKSTSGSTKRSKH